MATSDFGIAFQGGSCLELTLYACAAYAGMATERRSLSGGVVMRVTIPTIKAECAPPADSIKEATITKYARSFAFPSFRRWFTRGFGDNKGEVQPGENATYMHIQLEA